MLNWIGISSTNKHGFPVTRHVIPDAAGNFDEKSPAYSVSVSCQDHGLIVEIPVETGERIKSTSDFCPKCHGVSK